MNELIKSEQETEKTKAKKQINGVVYMYTNKNDGKVYIGETIHLERRKKTHMDHKSTMGFHMAIKEESYEVFEFSLLFECDGDIKEEVKRKIEEMEEYYINEYESVDGLKGYNFSRGVKWGMNAIYWELTEYDRHINGMLTHPLAYLQFGDLNEYREKILKEREELRIKLGAPF